MEDTHEGSSIPMSGELAKTYRDHFILSLNKHSPHPACLRIIVIGYISSGIKLIYAQHKQIPKLIQLISKYYNLGKHQKNSEIIQLYTGFFLFSYFLLSCQDFKNLFSKNLFIFKYLLTVNRFTWTLEAKIIHSLVTSQSNCKIIAFVNVLVYFQIVNLWNNSQATRITSPFDKKFSFCNM